MIFWTYWLMALLTVALMLRLFFREHDWRLQISAAIAIIPLLLRVLLIK